MAINPVDISALMLRREAKSAPGPTGPSINASQFEETLSAAMQGKGSSETSVSPAAAAEILRLRMLQSAVTTGNDGPERGGVTTGGLLKGYLSAVVDQKGSQEQVVPDTTVAEKHEVEALSPIEGKTSVDQIVARASRRYNVEEGLIKAVIKAESNFNAKAVSTAGAQGLMQLMPSTARGLGVNNPFDPEQNVMAGTRFLKDMLNRYNGNLDAALAAYNWGPGNVDKRGADLPRETREYLVRVKGYYAQYTG